MTEENVNNNTEPQDQPQPETPPAPAPDGDFSGKKAMAQEILHLREQLAQQAAAQKAAQDEAERKKLEEQGKFKELAEKAQRERDELKATYAAKERKLKLEAGFAGITDEFRRAGVIAMCPGDVEPDAYIAQVREQTPDLWGSPEPAPRISAQGMASRGSNQQSLKDKLAAGDRDTMKSVFSKVLAGESVSLD